jgi:hypothetical protein
MTTAAASRNPIRNLVRDAAIVADAAPMAASS